MDTPAWQDFRHSLPAELPTLEQAEAVYERIQTALNHFKVHCRMKDTGTGRMKQRWRGVKNWMTVYRRRE